MEGDSLHEVHIRQDQCIQDRTKARELSGLYVTRSEALHREPRKVSVSNTWHIKAPKGKEFQRSWSGVGASTDSWEFLSYAVHVEKITPQ